MELVQLVILKLTRLSYTRFMCYFLFNILVIWNSYRRSFFNEYDDLILVSYRIFYFFSLGNFIL